MRRAPRVAGRACIPVPSRSFSASSRRAIKSTLEAGENKSGHIHLSEPNEAVLFFNNVFPIKLQFLLRLPFNTQKALPELLSRLKRPTIAATDPIDILRKSQILEKAKIEIEEVLPRLKEGGAFVKFRHDPSVDVESIEGEIVRHLKEGEFKPWWNPWQRVSARLVRGRPWIEDMYRLPSSRVKVEFLPAEAGAEAAELSPEQLYSFFRPYGKLKDILTQPPDSKILPKFAHLDFALRGQAIMAKNCLHGIKVSEAQGGGKAGTLLRLTYEPRVKTHWIKDWFFSHPRIVIPALLAILGTITVAVFDPIRTFFIKAHITRSFHLADNKVYKWFKAQAGDILSFHRKAEDDPGMDAIWDDRKGNIEQIQTWLMETADTFIIVQGPRGSGKKELVVDQALKHKSHKLVIDCKPVQEARGDSATIAAAAAQVGYKPVFSWMNSISGMIDLAAQGAAGVKTGFSETLDSQLAKIWNNTATALKSIALDSRHKDDKDAHLGDDEWLEAHPERRPVVVVDNFLHKSNEGSIVYDKIADWAARLTTANIAHVIFLTNDVSFSKSLSKALPDRVFRQISLSDCSPEVAKRFVISHLDSDDSPEDDAENGAEKRLTPSQRRKDLVELDDCISALGGRLTDLEFLARRIKTGETPAKAVREIVEQSASEILKMYLLGNNNNNTASPSSSSSTVDQERHWTPLQAWLLIRSLARDETLRYNEMLLSPLYSGAAGDQALQSLEQAELITIVSANGRPHSIKPAKPVYTPAFKLLSRDRVLAARMDLALLKEGVRKEEEEIRKAEEELGVLRGLVEAGGKAELGGRVRWLLGRVREGQGRVEGMEGEMGRLKRTLREEF